MAQFTSRRENLIVLLWFLIFSQGVERLQPGVERVWVRRGDQHSSSSRQNLETRHSHVQQVSRIVVAWSCAFLFLNHRNALIKRNLKGSSGSDMCTTSFSLAYRLLKNRLKFFGSQVMPRVVSMSLPFQFGFLENLEFWVWPWKLAALSSVCTRLMGENSRIKHLASDEVCSGMWPDKPVWLMKL